MGKGMRSGKKAGVIFFTAVCFSGVIAAIALSRGNPLIKGITGLCEEIMAWEEELGENFWTDAVNQIGSGNVKAEYSLNLSGNPMLQNVTVGLDGYAKRDMEEKLSAGEVRVSVANVELGEVYGYGTENSFYLQVPSLWDGSVVFGTKDVSRQWNDSSMKKQLALAAGRELTIERDIDLRLFESFSTEPFSATAFLQENKEALANLYKNMEVLNLKKALKEGKLKEEQREELENTALKNVEGSSLKATCYLVILPQEELHEIFPAVTEEVRLCVFLDDRERIIRICTVPGEVLTIPSGELTAALNLPGEENTIDRVELEGTLLTAENFLPQYSGRVELEVSAVTEKVTEETGHYKVEGGGTLRAEENSAAFSVEGDIRGERTSQGERIAVTLEELEWSAEENVLFRLRGEAAFEPLTEKITIPAGKVYRLEEMGELETVLFLAECTKNVYRNYSGYLNMMENIGHASVY